MRTTSLVLASIFACSLGAAAWDGSPCRLAEDGKARVAIVVSDGANASVRQSAERLRDMLQRITGASFQIETGDGRKGLAVGMPEDFPALRADPRLATVRDSGIRDYFTAQQSYILRSHRKGIYILGASELAVEYAIWDLLYRIGYRQFMPGEVWEVVPRVSDLKVAVDVLEQPAYFDRRISGTGTNAREWIVRNRMSFNNSACSTVNGDFLPAMPDKWKLPFVETTHAYSFIVDHNPEVFKEHPEWMALSKGVRGLSTFLCISKPGLREFVAQDAVKYLKKYAYRYSISLDPTDGDGWCECDECQKMGKISNRPVLLANMAAEAIAKRFPGEHKTGA